MMQPVTVGKGNLIGGFLGKTLNIPKQVKIDDVGYLVFALAADAIQVNLRPIQRATNEASLSNPTSPTARK